MASRSESDTPGGSSVSREVGRFYDTAPYPTVRRLVNWSNPAFHRSVLDHLLRRRSEDALPADMKIWVAGCGTQQAVEFALNHPEAAVTATDLSEQSLAIARNLAGQLRLENIDFQHGDLLEAGYHEESDLIVSTGVIHHLAEPLEGVRVIRNALRPGGACFLFFYNRMHRRHGRRFQRLTKLLGFEEMDFGSRKDLGHKLFDLIMAMSPDSEWVERLNYFTPGHIRESAEFDDTLLHPQESSYDPVALLDLLESGGLRHSAWALPHLWEIPRAPLPSELAGLVDGLSDPERWMLAYLFLGPQSPHLEFYAERSDRPIPAPYTEEELRCRVPQLSDYEVREMGPDGILGAPRIVEGHRREGETLLFEPPGSPRSSWWYEFAGSTAPVFAACDGRNPIGEIAGQCPFPEEVVLRFFRDRLLPPGATRIAGSLSGG